MFVLRGTDGSGSIYNWVNGCSGYSTATLANLAVWDLDYLGSVAAMCFRYSSWFTMVAYDFS